MAPPPAGYQADCNIAQSAIVDLRPGQTGQFSVFCANTGSNSWTRGTATEASLVTCCPPFANVTFSTWIGGGGGLPSLPIPSLPLPSGSSSNRYATQTQATVTPGSNASFIFNLTVPPSTPSGLYWSYGVVVNGSGQSISRQAVTIIVNVP